MKAQKKITVQLPVELMNQAMDSTGMGLTPTLRKGLELVAAKKVYRKFLDLKGKFGLDINLDEFRRDRKK